MWALAAPNTPLMYKGVVPLYGNIRTLHSNQPACAQGGKFKQQAKRMRQGSHTRSVKSVSIDYYINKGLER